MLDGCYIYIQLCNLSQVLIYAMYLPFATDPSTSAPMHLKAWFRFVAWSCKSCKSSSIFLESKWVSHAKLPLTTLHPSTSSTIPVTSSSPVLVASNGVGRTQMRFVFFFFFSESSAASDSCSEKMNPPNFLWWCFFPADGESETFRSCIMVPSAPTMAEFSGGRNTNSKKSLQLEQEDET